MEQERRLKIEKEMKELPFRPKLVASRRGSPASQCRSARSISDFVKDQERFQSKKLRNIEQARQMVAESELNHSKRVAGSSSKSKKLLPNAKRQVGRREQSSSNEQDDSMEEQRPTSVRWRENKKHGKPKLP